MAKGRRERDRPKAAPDALYNPNKRVKLSYDSESEAEEGADERNPVVVDAKAAVHEGGNTPGTNAKISRNYDGHNDDAAPVDYEAESTERPGDNEATADGDEQTAATNWASEQRKNRSTGQWHALGSLAWQEDGVDEDEQESETDSAMKYLRAVRSERDTMPTVLSASRLHSQKKSKGNGFDPLANDHAFIAAPDPLVQDEDRPNDPREAFTSALRKRFLSQRHQLHLPPSSEAVSSLDDKHPIFFLPGNKKARAEWLNLLASTAPATAQVRSLDKDSVSRLLELIQDHYLNRQKEINRVTSAWIWSLLARLDEVGLMDNDQVYAVRAFGKRAVLVQVSFRSSEAAQQLEELANGGNDAQALDVAQDSPQAEVEGGEDRPPAAANASSEVGSVDRENTLATLDSILVIVGDIFGQRDLLEFRQPWDADEGAKPAG